MAKFLKSYIPILKIIITNLMKSIKIIHQSCSIHPWALSPISCSLCIPFCYGIWWAYIPSIMPLAYHYTSNSHFPQANHLALWPNITPLSLQLLHYLDQCNLFIIHLEWTLHYWCCLIAKFVISFILPFMLVNMFTYDAYTNLLTSFIILSLWIWNGHYFN